METANILLGKRIRALRKQQGLSQEQLAEQVGMSGKYLGEIERGQVNCSVDIVERIAKALDLELIDLFDYQHETNRKALAKKINSLIKDANDKELRWIYRILKSILS